MFAPNPSRSTTARSGPSAAWTSALPLVCGVHCLLTPILVSVVPLLDFGHRFEWIVLAVSAALVLGVVERSRPHHGSAAPYLPAVAGALVWGGSLALEGTSLSHGWMAAAGGALLAGAAFWNGWLLHRVHCREGGVCLVGEGAEGA